MHCIIVTHGVFVPLATAALAVAGAVDFVQVSVMIVFKGSLPTLLLLSVYFTSDTGPNCVTKQ